MLNNLHRLRHHMRLIALDLVQLLALDQSLHPAGIEIDVITTSATSVGQMLNRKTQTTRTGWSDHDPVAALREKLITQAVGKLLVVMLVIIPADTLFRQTCSAAGFKHIERTSAHSFRNKALVLFIAQPLILKVRKLHDVVITFHFFTRIPAGVFHPVQPERTAGLFGEMPVDDLAHALIQLCFCFVCSH